MAVRGNILARPRSIPPPTPQKSTPQKSTPQKSTPKCAVALLSFSCLVLACLCFDGGRPVPPATARPRSNLTARARAGEDVASAGSARLPPLEDLIARNGTVIGDISWMLDFAIIGFPKAGTTFLKQHLNDTAHAYVYEREYCMKRMSDVAAFVATYHALHVTLQQPKHPKTIRLGLKCPGVFYRADDLHIYATYFPRTKFIVGLRHPVSWFASFYNYQRYRNVSLPETAQLIGRCARHQKVCTDRARFHAALARLGKTPMTDEDELGLLFGSGHAPRRRSERRAQERRREPPRRGGLPNPALLYELRELHDLDAARDLNAALAHYLGVREGFPAISAYEQTKPRAIDICDGAHAPARRVLAEHGADAGEWIRRYLLKNPSIQVSSPGSFHRYLNDWGSDPCANKTLATNT